MVFTENKPSTEPYTFRFLKKLCSFSLIIILLFYTYNQFSQFSKSINTPNITLRKQSVDDSNNSIKISVRICSPDADVLTCKYGYNLDEPTLCEKAGPYPPEFEMTPLECNNTKEYLRYSFDYHKIVKVMINNTIDDFGVYLDALTIDKEPFATPFAIDPLDLIYSNKQNMIIYYSPTIITRTTRYAYGLINGVQVDNYVDFNAYADRAPLTATSGTTELILRSKSMDIYYQEETYNDLVSIASSVGGLFGALSGIFVFLFGASKLAPWGCLQNNCPCIKYRKKIVKKLKAKYDPVPFVGRTRNVNLEERVQMIENLLKEYYLDTDFLNLLEENNDEVNDKDGVSDKDEVNDEDDNEDVNDKDVV